MFTILYYSNNCWVDFITSALETGLINQDEANNIKNFDIERVSSLISYLGDQVHALPCSNFWKVIGPEGIQLPSYIGASYVIRGQNND